MSLNNRHLWILLGLTTALLVSILFVNQLLIRMDLAIYDLQLWFKSLYTINQQDQVVIVEIDKQSLEQVGSWPWPRSLHAQVINRLNQAGAKLIGFDIVFDLPSKAKEDQALKQSIKKANNLFFPTVFQASRQGNIVNIKEITYPLAEFRQAGVQTGYINLFPDRDGKIRRLNLIDHNLEPLAFKLAHSFNHQVEQFTEQELLINFHQNNYFPRLSYYQVLTGNYPPDLITDSLILVGTTSSTLGDYFMTPVGNFSPGVRIQAEIIDNYLQDSFIHPASNLAVVVMLFVISLTAAGLYFRLSPAKGVLLTFLLGIGCLVITTGLVVYFNIYFPVMSLELIFILNLISSNLVSYLQAEQKRHHLKNVFSRYLAPEVVKEVIALPEKDYLTGQRREITVLFIDLAGFTSFSEDKEAEVIVNLLNKYFSLITEETFALEGTLDKFLGDGTMIFFGAPTFQTDHAHRAVKLAVNIQQKINQKSKLPLSVSIGINTGKAVVGNVGSRQRTDYTAIGNPVNTAARIEARAEGGEIIIGETTYKLINNQFSCQLKEEIILRGKKQPDRLYQINYKKGAESYAQN